MTRSRVIDGGQTVMQTQLEAARAGRITPAARRVAEREGLAPEQVRDFVAAGRVVIPANVHHLPAALGGDGSGVLDPLGIGRPLRTKVNANLGTSPDHSCQDEERVKMELAVRYGADAVMDLSTGGDLDAIRRHLIAHATVPLGTVPIYEMIRDRPIEALTREEMLATIEKQARQGVDFFTIHAGILREHLPLAARRLAGIVSRGGSLLAAWMTHHEAQNPFYEMFDDLCAILRAHDVAFSLGDGLRPGCLADASDEAQFAELRALGGLVRRARAQGCQVMVEGPGHVPFDQIERNMRIEEELCDGAPFYVLGPVVTDAAPGYDHITSAIGATAAAYHGAAFLCYVTPAEHLGLPGPADVREGVIAHRIAAHAADIARGLPGARERDDAMSRARAAFDWEAQMTLALDATRAREIRKNAGADEDFCSMCGRDWCAMRRSRDVLARHRDRP
ncbi:MAG: phosphomethylpyrimidine synthase ThiC [Candidatus Eisenbacteria bacterium]|uniref:Phosphomethylpyrimidine synthase n=1 Tax=Eiseniibacteriota bacterium TaxID=2212470 RepID=A0A937X9T8_UNCEI|nr:phosphomethylpyrimidine synthase ThiC [Candidatus Eisenbacteria bacterium]